MKDRILDYIKELEIRLLDSGEQLPSMREDVKHLLNYEKVAKHHSLTNEQVKTIKRFLDNHYDYGMDICCCDIERVLEMKVDT